MSSQCSVKAKLNTENDRRARKRREGEEGSEERGRDEGGSECGGRRRWRVKERNFKESRAQSRCPERGEGSECTAPHAPLPPSRPPSLRHYLATGMRALAGERAGTNPTVGLRSQRLPMEFVVAGSTWMDLIDRGVIPWQNWSVDFRVTLRECKQVSTHTHSHS